MSDTHIANPAATNSAEPDHMDSPYDRYDDWAWLYDKTVGEEYERAQWQWLERELVPRLQPGARLLDLCCGSGQLIRPLLAAGFDVTGLDGSAAMLDCARNNAGEAEYLLADARSFSLPTAVNAVVSTSASLNHIESIDDLALVFKQVHQALVPDGWFLFDINHHDQMCRWWQGRPLEGEIHDHYAWMITPNYNAELAKGSFEVLLYQAPAEIRAGQQRPGLIQQAKNSLYKLLSRPRFIGLRLALIARLRGLQPGWHQQRMDYPVTGHDLNQVREQLRVAGFTSIQIQTIDGSPVVDANHSAHFICRREAK